MGRTRDLALGLSLALAAGLLAAEAPAPAPVPPPRPLALVGGLVRTQTDAGDFVGAVVVRGGHIEAAGPDVKVPADAVRIDASKCVITPGLIDARGTLGLHPAAAREGGREAALDVLDAVDPFAEDWRDGLAAEEHNFLHPGEAPRTAYLTEKLRGAEGPFIAVSDFMHAVPDQIRPFVPGDFATLGADGFGFSDTRPAARRFFHIDGPSVAVRALQMLAARGEIDAHLPQEAAKRYRLLDVTAGTSGTAGGDA